MASLLQQSRFKIQAVYSEFEDMEQKLAASSAELLFLIGCQTASPSDLQKISAFKHAHPGSHVVLLINSCSEKQRWEAAHCGLDGVLLKSISAEVLCLSLELVLKSQSVFIVDPESGDDDPPPDDRIEVSTSSDVIELSDATTSAGDLPNPPRDGNDLVHEAVPPIQNVMVSSRREGLSDREFEILDCLVKGHSNKVIARRCNITEATVKVHLKAILRKISVANRTQAAVWAINRMHRISSPANGLSSALSIPPPLTVNGDGREHPDGDDAEEGRLAHVDPPATLSLIKSRSLGGLPSYHR
ncbi:hypothetical protein ASG43_05130 [Aureimonas sp. Leaf454]|nr:hypothetical protein ASG43_05130 [Aureimonas sp. Leaf454]